MEKKDSIKFENAAIRAAGSRMANMFQPRIPMGPGEHEGYKEARRAFYEGFQEGAAFYRILVSRIDDEFANLIEGVRIDSGSGEDTHSVMETCMKNGIPVITAMQKASCKNEREKMYQDLKNFIATVPLDISLEDVKKYAEEHTMESEPEEPSKDDSAVPVTMEACIKGTPERCRACDFHTDCPRSCANIEKKDEEAKAEEAQADPDDICWKHPIDKIEKALQNLGVKFEVKDYGDRLFLNFALGVTVYAIYFEKQADGNYKVVFSERDLHDRKVLWDGVVTDRLTLFDLEHSIAAKAHSERQPHWM